MKIAVTSAYPLDSTQGNVASVKRIASLLGAVPCCGTPTERPDILIALHARKSAPALIDYWKNSGGHTIVLLTGTDLYKDIPHEDPTALQVLANADLIAVYHDEAIADIPASYRHKARVCGKSVAVSLPSPRSPRCEKLISFIGHMRAIKAPFLANEALQLLEDPELRLQLLGQALEPTFADRARAYERADSRFTWRKGLSHHDTIYEISRSSLTINSSLAEGGSNAVAESIICGTPVLATNIPGNVGMLGRHYPGFFPAGDAHALAELIRKYHHEPDFRAALQKATIERAPHFSPERERQSWQAIIDEVRQRS